MIVLLLGTATLLLTLFGNAIVGLIAYIIVVSILFVWSKKIWLLIWASVCYCTALISLVFYHLHYQLDNSADYFFGSVVVQEKLRNQRFVVQDYQGKTMIVYAPYSRKPGDIIYLTASKKPVRDQQTLFETIDERYQRRYDFDAKISFDYDRWMLMKGYSATLYHKSSIYQGYQDLGLIVTWRNALIDRIDQTFPDSQPTRALVAGFLVGERSGFTPQQYETFIDAGLVHLVAVSGGNIVMVIIFLHAILFFLPFYFRLGCVFVGVILYAMLCGADSSVVRATLMALLTMTALMFGRSLDIMRLLAYTFVVMIIINPYYLIADVGFLLSFGAVIGIVQGDKLFQKLTQGATMNFFQKSIKEYLVPTLGATVGVFPFLMFFMGKVNIRSVFVNVVIVPFVPLMMIAGLISMVSFVIGQGLFVIPWVEYVYESFFVLAERVANNGLYVVFVTDMIKYVVLVTFCLFIIYRLMIKPMVNTDIYCKQQKSDGLIAPGSDDQSTDHIDDKLRQSVTLSALDSIDLK